MCGKIKQGITVLAGILLAVPMYSCRNETGNDPLPVEFTASIREAESKASLGGNSFENGDRFILYWKSGKPTAAVDPIYTYNGTKWAVETGLPVFWDDYKPTAGTPISFCAVSPYSTDYNVDIAADTDSYPVKADQSTEVDFKESDLLIACQSADMRFVPITFRHAYSRILLTLTASLDPADTEGCFTSEELASGNITVKLRNLFAKGTIVYSSAAFTTEAVTTDPPVDFTMLRLSASEDSGNKKYTLAYAAIVPPYSTLPGGSELVEITVGGTPPRKYVFKVADSGYSGFALQGKQTNVNVRLVKSRVLPAEIDYSDVSIEPWGTISAQDDDPVVLN